MLGISLELFFRDLTERILSLGTHSADVTIIKLLNNLQSSHPSLSLCCAEIVSQSLNL